jgi:hypothetical protein
MRSLIVAAWVFFLAAGAALAQMPSCPTGQVYDQAQKKCMVNSSASKSNGY